MHRPATMMDRLHRLLLWNPLPRPSRDPGHAGAVHGVRQSDGLHHTPEISTGKPGQRAGDGAALVSQPGEQRKQGGMYWQRKYSRFPIPPLLVELDRVVDEVDSLHRNLRGRDTAGQVERDLEGDSHPIAGPAKGLPAFQFGADDGNLLVGELGLRRRAGWANLLADSKARIARAVAAPAGLAHDARHHFDVMKGGVAGYFFAALFLYLALAPCNEVHGMLVGESARNAHFVFPQEEAQELPSTQVAGDCFRILEAQLNPRFYPVFPARGILFICSADAAHALFAGVGVGFELAAGIADLNAGRFIDAASAQRAVISDVPSRSAGARVDGDVLHRCQQVSASDTVESNPTLAHAIACNPIYGKSSSSWFESRSGSQRLNRYLCKCQQIWQQFEQERGRA